MARTKISEFSSTAADNTDIDGIDIAEGCAPSGINNAIRTLMADLKDMQTGASGDTFTFASLNATTANINGGTIDGTTIGGTSAAAVSSTNLSYTGTLTGGTGVINIGSGQLYKDASGNVGIGTSSPGYRLDVVSSDVAAGYTARLRSNATAAQTILQFTDSAATLETARIVAGDTRFLSFGTNGAERMRIDSSGNLLVGTATTQGQITSVSTSNSKNALDVRIAASGDVGTEAVLIGKFDNNNTTSQVFTRFTINNRAFGCGQINANGASQVAFGAWSDARLKENIVDLPPQLDNIMALRPVEFDYIESEGGGHQISFIAQEFEQVYPDAIGERSDGMKTLTGWGKTEARLVKAIQEQQAMINELRNEIAALKGA